MENVENSTEPHDDSVKPKPKPKPDQPVKPGNPVPTGRIPKYTPPTKT